MPPDPRAQRVLVTFAAVESPSDLDEADLQELQLTAEVHGDAEEEAVARALRYEQQERLQYLHGEERLVRGIRDPFEQTRRR